MMKLLQCLYSVVVIMQGHGTGDRNGIRPVKSHPCFYNFLKFSFWAPGLSQSILEGSIQLNKL